VKVVIWKRYTYQINDSIVIQQDSDIGSSRLSILAWKGIIDFIFIHEVDNDMQLFFREKYYD
jgi:hypothetical protein